MAFRMLVDNKEVNLFLKKMPKQIPFAMSKALNETALDVRNHIVKSVWQHSVSPKARGFAARAFRTRWSNKRDLIAAVYADPSRVSASGIEAINRVEQGIRHYPYRGRYLAVPTWHALTGAGRLKKAARLALSDRSSQTFVKDFKGKGPAIWQRTNTGLRLLFILKSSVDTPRVFPFGREAARRAKRKWSSNLVKSIRLAERTAFSSGFSNTAPGKRGAFRLSRRF